jgi:hypothetical protein
LQRTQWRNGKSEGEKAITMPKTYYHDSSSFDSECAGLVALSASQSSQYGTWIVDSGATCHMCHDSKLFTDLHHLKDLLQVVLGDGNSQSAAGKGNVMQDMKLPNGKTRKRKLHNVLYIPTIFSVCPRPLKEGRSPCYLRDKEHMPIAKTTKEGSLYHLNCQPCHKKANSSVSLEIEVIWHRCFGHLGIRRLARKKLVNVFNFDATRELTFCEPCEAYLKVEGIRTDT